jgi:diacylglycerol kinase
MARQLQVHEPRTKSSRRRRAPWRQRLVEAERGVTEGFRGDSTFFVHFFLGSLMIVAAAVLGISFVHWILLVLALTLVLCAEMFNSAFATLLLDFEKHAGVAVKKARKIGTAAVFVAMAGATIAVGLIFTHRLMQMFAA